MDERLEKALDFSNFRMILSKRQENLKTLMDNKLILSYEGGLFKIDQSLLSYLWGHLMVDAKSVILIDKNDIPVKITNIKDFADQVEKKYVRVIEQYYDSYQKLSEAREIRKVLDLDEK